MQMWSERVFVVVAMDRQSQTVEVIAVFTELEGPTGARAFAAAQPRAYYRRTPVRSRRFAYGREETDAELRERWKASEDDRALGWRACEPGITYPLEDFEVKLVEFFVCDRPWNPPIATWMPSNPERVLGAVTLEEPGGKPQPKPEYDGMLRTEVVDAQIIHPIEFETLPPDPDAPMHVVIDQAWVDADGVFRCSCGASHSRGPINGEDSYRCLACGQVHSINPPFRATT